MPRGVFLRPARKFCPNHPDRVVLSRGVCRHCYRKLLPKQHASASRKFWLKYNYGITQEDYDKMLLAQDGHCAMCPKQGNKGRRLSVDHCHKTKEVRGLLCNACNLMVGCVEGDPNRLETIKAYLYGRKA